MFMLEFFNKALTRKCVQSFHRLRNMMYVCVSVTCCAVFVCNLHKGMSWYFPCLQNLLQVTQKKNVVVREASEASVPEALLCENFY